MPVSLILDILVAVLLVVTIGYAVTLNKRLSALRRDKGELERLARGFAETTEKAEMGIGELRAMTDLLQERIGRAESLRDDLVFLMERGNAAADRLEGVVRDSRDKTGAAPAPAATGGDAPAVSAKPAAPPKPRGAPIADPAERPAPDDVSDAERELLKALRTAG
jgi:hypothetical protein